MLTFKARVMQALIIKSHRVGTEYNQPHLFILNKGNNSGKPLNQACPNCFVCLVDSTEEREQLYWILFSLWRSKSLHQYLRSSVIPFIINKDLADCIREAQSIATSKPEEFQKSVTILRKLDEMELQYKQSLKLIEEAKQIIFHKFSSF